MTDPGRARRRDGARRLEDELEEEDGEGAIVPETPTKAQAENLSQLLAMHNISDSYDPEAEAGTKGYKIPKQVLTDHTDKRRFLTQPGPRGQHVLCHIRRTRGKAGMFPEYFMYLDDGNTFLMSARKRKKSRSSNYILSLDEEDMARESGNYFGKLRSNFIGTEFVMFDKGVKPASSAQSVHQPLRTELGAVIYEHNVMGMKGPRKMTVVLPSVQPDGSRVQYSEEGERILDRYKKDAGSPNIMVYSNKKPKWNPSLGAYCLNFNGRVTEASVKNFQLAKIEDRENGDVAVQFGKIGKDVFTMDFQWPVSAIQAFSICLSSFDSKLAYE